MLKLILGIIAAIVLISIIWRLLSRFCVIPCPSWLGWMVEMDNPFTSINRAKTIIAQLDLKPGMKVADIGCGPGRLTIPLAQAVGPQGSVTAMDIQEEMLAKVRAKAQAANLSNIVYLHAGVGQNKLPLNNFDRIVLVTVLGEIPEQLNALQEIYRALKPGGILSVTEFIFDPHFQRKATVQRLAQQAGLQEVACHGSWYAYTMQFKKQMKA